MGGNSRESGSPAFVFSYFIEEIMELDGVGIANDEDTILSRRVAYSFIGTYGRISSGVVRPCM